jgi:8-oxo-dGTP diphosphatase
MSNDAETEGCQIILVNNTGAVLLQLRDDKPSIPFPNMWAIPGGVLEPGESAKACIEREIQEEMSLVLPAHSIRFLGRVRRSYGIEHTFNAPLHIDPCEITLNEGQRVDWFSHPQVATMHLAYEDNAVLDSFFNSRHSSFIRTAAG